MIPNPVKTTLKSALITLGIELAITLLGRPAFTDAEFLIITMVGVLLMELPNRINISVSTNSYTTNNKGAKDE